MVNLEAFGTAVSAAVTTLEDAITSVRLARNRLDLATGILSAAACGSVELPPVVARHREALRHAGEGDQSLTRAVDDLTDYLASIGVAPAPSGTHPSVRTASVRPVEGKPSPTLEQRRDEEIAAKRDLLGAALSDEDVRRLLESLPRKSLAGDGEPTRGWLQFRGRRVPLISGPGRRGEAGVHDDLDYQAAVNTWRVICERVLGKRGLATWDLAEAGHAEIKAAIRQRAGGVRHSSMVINHPNGPCGGHPTKCRELLEEFLPPGHTMTIYWPGGSLVATGR